MVLAKQRSDIIWNRYNFPISMEGCVLYLPLWQEDTRLSPFLSYDQYYHSATVTGATWGSQGRTFDGSTHYISCGDISQAEGLTTLSIISWIKPNSGSWSPTARATVGKNNGFGLGHEGGTDGTAQFRIYDTAWRSSGDTTTVLDVATWFHLSGTYGSGTLRVFVSAVEENSAGGFGTTASNANAVYVGSLIDATRAFGGLIGEVLIYNRQLSAGEIAQHYQMTKWRYSS